MKKIIYIILLLTLNVVSKDFDEKSYIDTIQSIKNTGGKTTNLLNLTYKYKKLAMIYQKNKQDKLAIEYWIKVSAVAKYYEESIAYANISLIYKKHNNYNESIRFLLKEIEIKEYYLSPKDKWIYFDYKNLAELYEYNNKYIKAIFYYKKVLEMIKDKPIYLSKKFRTELLDKIKVLKNKI